MVETASDKIRVLTPKKSSRKKITKKIKGDGMRLDVKPSRNRNIAQITRQRRLIYDLTISWLHYKSNQTKNEHHPSIRTVNL